MRIRKLLLIHPSRSIRALIEKFIFAELNDIEMAEADCGLCALEKIDQKNFDIIIFSELLKDMDLKEFESHKKRSTFNGRTPLIVLSENESAQSRDELERQGFEHVVQIRVRPADLIEKINAVCDPRQWRKDTRYHIPHATIIVSSPNRMIEASLINVSRGGVLVELTTEDPCELMNGGLSLTLQIPISDSTSVIGDLTTKLLRIETVAWSPDHVPKTMRGTFIFVDLNPGPKRKLEELIQMAKEDKLAATVVKK